MHVNDLCVFVFPVGTTEDKQPIVSQETEQPSVPVHTGNYICHTFTDLYHVVNFTISNLI